MKLSQFRHCNNDCSVSCTKLSRGYLCEKGKKGEKSVCHVPSWLKSTICFTNLQWRNRLAHGTYRQCNEECRGCEFEPHLEQVFFYTKKVICIILKCVLDQFVNSFMSRVMYRMQKFMRLSNKSSIV